MRSMVCPLSVVRSPLSVVLGPLYFPPEGLAKHIEPNRRGFRIKGQEHGRRSEVAKVLLFILGIQVQNGGVPRILEDFGAGSKFRLIFWRKLSCCAAVGW